ncbi:MAG: hypothetical protein JJE15_13235 [Desulfobacteraceae bacterium]|nr:hypothetical protein [Desulfobacteraceae bacterium]
MKLLSVVLMVVIVLITPNLTMAGDIGPALGSFHSGPMQGVEQFRIVPGPNNLLLFFDMKEGYVWAGYLDKKSGKFCFEHVTFDKQYRSAAESKGALNKAVNQAETVDLLKSIQMKREQKIK